MTSYIRSRLDRLHHARFRACLIAGFALVLLCVMPAGAAAVPTGFQEQTAFSGLTGPTALAFASDGRAFVSEKSGLIKEFDSLSDTTPTTVADLRTEVYNSWDRGLLSIALDPQFPARPYLYALYTRDALPGGNAPHWGQAGQTSDPCPDPPGATTDGCVATGRLVRLTLSGNSVTGQTTLITDWCEQFPSHSIGDLVFGADGALYVSGGEGASFTYADWGQSGNPVNPCGDPPGGPGTALTPPTAEGGSLRSQDARTTADPTGLDGSIIRIDPDTGAAMPGNPFGSSPDANQRRIVAYGFRNPFRFTFRPGTNEIWVGDVGSAAWEEIDRVLSPADSSADNFGWPCYEGSGETGFDALNLDLCKSLYTAGTALGPYYAYSHTAQVVNGENCPNGSSAISGVAFYPGGGFPAAYDGALFFSDYGRKCIWAMLPGANGLPDPSNIQTFDQGALNPVNLVNGPSGDLFYVNLGASAGGSADGSIQRIRFPHENSPPVARATANPSSGNAPLQVALDATGSTDPDGDALTYAWDLDENGTFETTGASVSKTYSTPGSYHPKVRVTDPDGASDTDSVTVQAGNTAPSAQIDAPADSLTWAVGDQIQFSGSATDAQESMPASGYSWNVIIHHCPNPSDPNDCHTHPYQQFEGVTGGSFPAPDHEYPSYLEIQLTVTDSGGLTGSDSVKIYPTPVQLAVGSTPSGVEVGIDQGNETTPFSETVIENSQHSLAAPPKAEIGGQTYYFNSWSDGKAAAHTIAVSEDTDLGVTYSMDQGPAAVVSAVPSTGSAPLPVTLDASGSTDPDSPPPLTFAWDLDGDGQFDDATGPVVSQTYVTPGDYAPAVRVSDSDGAYGTASASLHVTDPLAPSQVLGTSTASCAGKVPTIVGTKGSDRLVGTASADVIAGLGGRDRLIGRGGNDRLCGGTGADVLKGGGGRDVLEGGRGSDRCVGGPGTDQASRCERYMGL
jgi:glucose/arabinose dehydrogenase/Ca2+-binding RTX toxin-like protein